MALSTPRPFNELSLAESTTSIAASPVAMLFAAPCHGYLQRGSAVSGGTTTGTITVAVTVNGGSDVFAGALTIAAGTGPVNNGSVTLPLTGVNAVFVKEGDAIVATPSGGTGASISGAVTLTFRSL